MLPAAPATLVLSRDHPGLVRRKGLHRVRPGVYVDAERWRALTPWDRYLLRVHAVIETWTDPTFCLESSAVLLGMPVFGEPRHVHLLSTDATTWRRGDVIVHGARDGRSLEIRDGVAMTTVRETAVDLSRVLPPAFALAVVDATLRRFGDAEAFDLRAHARLQQNRRGLVQVDWVQGSATPLAESVGESVSRAVIGWLGFEPPVLQHEFEHEGGCDRVDFWFPGSRVIGESDGYGKYDASNPESMKQHFIREKTREDRLRRQVDGFARWDWADALRWRPLEAKLRAAGLVPVRPRRSSWLGTLDSNTRSLPTPGRTRPLASNPTIS